MAIPQKHFSSQLIEKEVLIPLCFLNYDNDLGYCNSHYHELNGQVEPLIRVTSAGEEPLVFSSITDEINKERRNVDTEDTTSSQELIKL